MLVSQGPPECLKATVLRFLSAERVCCRHYLRSPCQSVRRTTLSVSACQHRTNASSLTVPPHSACAASSTPVSPAATRGAREPPARSVRHSLLAGADPCGSTQRSGCDLPPLSRWQRAVGGPGSPWDG